MSSGCLLGKVENWTHVRKILGYLRYDTFAELSIINDLNRGDLRLYKNFFQPVMKLVSKERIGGSVKRKYDTPKTPYQRLMDSGQISEQTRKQLGMVYLSLNPAQLKRSIDTKLGKLYQAYEKKGRSEQGRANEESSTPYGYIFHDTTTSSWVTYLNDLTRAACSAIIWR